MAADGSFLTGTFADYLLPTTAEVPDPLILHMETPSPFTPLGAEGRRRGQLHVDAGLHRQRGGRCARRARTSRCRWCRRNSRTSCAAPSPRRPAGRRDRGDRRAQWRPASARRRRGQWLARRRARSGPCCSIPRRFRPVIPGCHSVEKISDTHFRADVTIGIGPVKGRYRAEVKLSDLDPPHAVTLGGSAEGALGFGGGEGRITLHPTESGGTASATSTRRRSAARSRASAAACSTARRA